MSVAISLKHIAQAVGLSRTAVSLALRDHPRIAPATRERVQKVAQEMGYTPNADISKVMGLLRDNRHPLDNPVLGFITDSPEPISTQAPMSPTWKGFSERARALGYRPEEFWLGDKKITVKRLQKILRTRNIRGFVVSVLRNPLLLEKMNFSHFSTAAIGHSMHHPLLHRVASDKFSNTILTCENLWAQGCRRIGLAVPQTQEFRVEHLFLSGYLVFHHLHHHRDWKFPLVEDSPWHPPRIARWAKAKKLDGLVVGYPGLETVLPDIPLAQVNLLHGAGMGINQCHDRIAAGAVDLVDAQLRRNHVGIPEHPKTMLIIGEWTEID